MLASWLLTKHTPADVEWTLKKALLGRVDAYAFSRGQQCSCFTIQITVFYEVRAGEQKVYEWGPKIWKIWWRSLTDQTSCRHHHAVGIEESVAARCSEREPDAWTSTPDYGLGTVGKCLGPTYVVVLFIWLFAVFTVIYYAVRLIIAFVDVNKTYLILSYLILSYIGIP